MEFKGTQGTWTIQDIASEILEGTMSSRIFSNRYKINEKVIGRVNATHNEEGYANAKLIAAAPELLEFAIEMVKRYPNSQWITEQGNKAINKALK